jgi:hypothetical protein
MATTATLAAALTAGAIAVTVAVLPANGQDQPGTRTLTFTSVQKDRDANFVDLKPKGESVGDRFTFSSTLRRQGKPKGRVEVDCVGVDKTYEGFLCGAVAILADGRLTLSGAALDKPLAGVGRVREEFSVTSGTGAYTGATGTMTRKGNGKRDTLTFTLAP